MTLNALHEKIQKELNTLHTTILKPSKSIHNANYPKDKQHHGEIQKSIEVRFGEIQLKLGHELLKLNGLNSSRQEITPIVISSMIKQANQYRHQARLKNIIINN